MQEIFISNMEKREFSCNMCNKSYTRKFSLEHHIDKVHYNRVFTCEICKVTTGRKRPHSCAVPDGPSECFACGLRFVSSKAMFRHRRITHSKSKIESEIDRLLDEEIEIAQFSSNMPTDIHPAIEHFILDENTVVYFEDTIYMKCPLCLNVYNTLDSFREHIDGYPFLSYQQKNEFFEAVDELIADITTEPLYPMDN